MPDKPWCPGGHALDLVREHGRNRARCSCGLIASLDPENQRIYREADAQGSGSGDTGEGTGDLGPAPGLGDGGTVHAHPADPDAGDDGGHHAPPADGTPVARQWTDDEVSAAAQVPEPPKPLVDVEAVAATVSAPRGRGDILDHLRGVDR